MEGTERLHVGEPCQRWHRCVGCGGGGVGGGEAQGVDQTPSVIGDGEEGGGGRGASPSVVGGGEGKV